MKVSFLKKGSILGVFLLLLCACANDVSINMPKGPKGDKGDNGKSAFESWIEFYGKDPNTTTLQDFFDSMKGDKGEDGKNGLTPEVGDNGNWWIGGKDTGISSQGKDGLTPYVGANGNWWIGNTDTKVPAKGEDGKDGLIPEVGDNGNWWIGGKDTGISPQGKDGLTPHVGTNGNWWIGNTDTKIPVRGKDGEQGKNGQSAYDLWKIIVEKGEIKNPDGTDYTGGTTEIEFMEWLRNGKASVLYQTWVKLPGNDGKTIEDFIFELFSCHCDDVTVIPRFYNDCITIKDGVIAGSYIAELLFNGYEGTKVVAKDETGKILYDGVIDNKDKTIKFPQTTEEHTITFTYTPPKKIDSKSITIKIPKLNPVTLNVDVQLINSLKAKVIINSGSIANSQFIVGGLELEDGKDGWTKVSNGFERIYDRGAFAQNKDLTIKNKNYHCATATFAIPSLEVVVKPEIEIKSLDNCSYEIILKGESGLKIVATSTSPSNVNHKDLNNKEVTENPTGEYHLILKKDFNSLTIKFSVSKDGAGTNNFNYSITEEGYIKSFGTISELTNEASYAYSVFEITNPTDKPIKVEMYRGSNSQSSSIKRGAWIDQDTIAYTIPANSSKKVNIYKDYTPRLGSGSYTLYFKLINECGIEFKRNFSIYNQTRYGVNFTLIPGPGDKPVIEIEVHDLIPGSYMQVLLLLNGNLFTAVINKQLDKNGSLKTRIVMEPKDFDTAVANGSAKIILSSDFEATDVINETILPFKFN